jgi:cell division protein FtsZ
MPARRERMLSEATLPTVRYEVPIEPRISMSRATPAKFLSDDQAQRPVSAPLISERGESSLASEAVAGEPGAGAEQRPQLVPVPASVFDDDFFRATQGRAAVSHATQEPVRMETGLREGAYYTPSENAQLNVPVAESGTHTPFGGAVAQADSSEPDELDIPAFLRRGH